MQSHTDNLPEQAARDAMHAELELLLAKALTEDARELEQAAYAAWKVTELALSRAEHNEELARRQVEETR